jgi:acyl carrier protein
LSIEPIAEVRRIVTGIMRERGLLSPNGDDESLFASGKLDSMMAVELILRLETEFGIDFSRLDFDISLIDSVNAITALVLAGRNASKAA